MLTSGSWQARADALPLPVVSTLLLPLVAVGAVVAQADVRVPLGLPGHRGLLWLTVLVVVAFAQRRAGTVTAVGAMSSLLAVAMGTDPAMALPYAAAGALLDAALTLPALRRAPVLLVPLAAPIHLVALTAPVLRGAGLLDLGTKTLAHLGFGLAAGVTGWLITRAGRARPIP